MDSPTVTSDDWLLTRKSRPLLTAGKPVGRICSLHIWLLLVTDTVHKVPFDPG